MIRFAMLLAAAGLSTAAFAADAPSVEFGKHISIVGGCHDCHTVGYNESAGKVDPNVALMGSPAGFPGPWGTTFAKNIRIAIKDMSEDDFVKFSDTFQAAPPMPWYNVHALTDVEARSLYQYIKSLPGGLGEQAPPAVPPPA
jgi:cytochrome c553